MEQGGRGLCVRRLGGNRAGEIRITRFLRNRGVTSGEMLAEAAARTSQRCLGRDVLVIQDTTVIRSEGGGGDYLHAAIALDEADGAILGLVSGRFLQRSSGRKQARRSLPIEEKESFRWLEGADEAASVGAGAARVTVIADREGDIYEAFALRPHGTDLLIRAAQDRSLEDGGRLFARLDSLPQTGQAETALPAGPGRRARKARLGLRFATMMLARPVRLPGANLPAAVEMQLITAALIAAVAVQQLVHGREGDQAHLRPCTDVFEPDDIPLLEAWCAKLEGKTERQKNPHPKRSLAYAAWVCARLGGWTGYYGKPGPVVMLNGWLELQASRRTKNLLDEQSVV
jgi:hypothetical protein